jgi:hypothetical protein
MALAHAGRALPGPGALLLPGTLGATPDSHHGLLDLGLAGRARLPGLAQVVSVIAGAAMLIWPLVWPSPYLAAPVWLGFILLLDPINRRLGGESLAGDLVEGRNDRLKNLVLSGFLCGILWELWNYWARAKWHYTVPIMENVKIFEMPVPGYLGFPAFALECFTMYVFARTVCVSTVSGFGPFVGPGRPIALSSDSSADTPLEETPGGTFAEIGTRLDH